MNKLIAVSLAVASVASAHALTVDVYASPAPNFFGSSSWGGYLSNAMFALENGLTTFGAAGPTQYTTTNGQVRAKGDNLVTGYSSWMGVADAASPYDAELGTRWHFGVHILGSGTQFSLSQVTFNMTSLEESGLNYSGNFIGSNYSATRVGINYVDGIKGNGNDIIINSGSETQLVDELIYVGVGNAYASYTTDPGATNQDKIDGILAQINPYRLSTSYTVDLGANQVTGSAYTDFGAVPEPFTMLGLAALAGLAAKRKR